MTRHRSASSRQRSVKFRKGLFWRLLAVGCICVALVPVAGYERDVMATATAPYRFSAAGWELAHLPDKWFRRLVRIPTALAQARPHEQKVADVHEFFATNRALRSIDRQLIALGIVSPATPETAVSMAALRRQQVSPARPQRSAAPRRRRDPGVGAGGHPEQLGLPGLDGPVSPGGHRIDGFSHRPGHFPT